VVQERTQAEPAENQCGKCRKKQNLQDEGSRPKPEQKQNTDGQGEGARHPPGEPAGDENIPPKDSGQAQKDRGRPEDDGQKDDRPDQPRLKHEGGEPEGAALLHRSIQPLLKDEIPHGIPSF